MKSKLFITGGSGFIGRNFIDKFHDKYDILAIARNSSILDETKCKVFRYGQQDINYLNKIFMEENSVYGGGITSSHFISFKS